MDGDLEETFWAYDVHYPTTYGNFYTPFWVRYDVRWVLTEVNRNYPIGPQYRLPIEVRAGILRPNFIIGETWEPGTYEIRWKYRDWENSDIEFRSVLFVVESAGTGYLPWNFDNYLDLPASMNITS